MRQVVTDKPHILSCSIPAIADMPHPKLRTPFMDLKFLIIGSEERLVPQLAGSLKSLGAVNIEIHQSSPLVLKLLKETNEPDKAFQLICLSWEAWAGSSSVRNQFFETMKSLEELAGSILTRLQH